MTYKFPHSPLSVPGQLYKDRRKVTASVRHAAEHLFRAASLADNGATDEARASRIAQCIHEIIPHALSIRELLELVLDVEQAFRERCKADDPE